MTEDFKKWLNNHPETKAEYESNPEWREDIFIDYQKETAYKDFDTWLSWALKNEETARTHFPHVFETIEKAVTESSDFQSATVIQTIADGFPKQRKEAEELIGPAKQKFIKTHINIIRLVLADVDKKPQLEKDTILNREDEFEANLKYWENELTKLDSKSDSSISSENETAQKIISLFDAHKGWDHYFDKEKDFKQLLELLQLNLSGREYTLPNNPIKTKKRTKTDLGNLLGRIHKLSPVQTLRSDKKFIALIKTIDSFQNEKNVYRAITRDR
ncbi:hypothetical protein N9F17_02200 [Salibacteraceae bacterium]|nr:hypothetical protein [Salibacteraceae bacterium]